MITNEVKEIASQIGQFFLKESTGDYTAACNEITRLHINKLELENGKLTVETSRPGLLIGKRGERIEKLQKYLGISLCIIETKEHIVDYIYPYEVDDDDLGELLFDPQEELELEE